MSKKASEQYLDLVQDTIKQINDSEWAPFIWITIAIVLILGGWLVIPFAIAAWVVVVLIEKTSL